MSLDLDCANYEDDFLSPDDSRDSAESESESENVPEFLQLGHLPKSAASGAGTAAQTKGSKGKGDGTKSRYKHVPHCEKPPQVVEKRNARERKRVQTVNSAFVKLRKFIPYENRHKRLSKVKTLRKAIEYIDHLQGLLAEYDKGHSSATPPPCTTPILSAPTYPEHPNSIATPDQLLLPHQQLLAPDDHNMLYGQPLTTGAVTTEQSFYKTDAHFTQMLSSDYPDMGLSSPALGNCGNIAQLQTPCSLPQSFFSLLPSSLAESSLTDSHSYSTNPAGFLPPLLQTLPPTS